MDRWEISKQRKKMTLEEVVEVYSGNCRVTKGIRVSERGACTPVYITLDVEQCVGVRSKEAYVSSTDRGFGGKGDIKVEDEIVVKNGEYLEHGDINLKEKREVWIYIKTSDFYD